MNWTKRLNQGPRNIALGGGRIELLNWSYAPYLPDNRPHRHTHFEICQVGTHGQGRFIVENRPHELNPRDVFIARPGVTHQILNTASPNMELFWVSFILLPSDRPTGEVDALLRGFTDAHIAVAADNSERVAALWRALIVVGQGDPRPGAEEQLRGLITSLLLAFAQVGSVPDKVEVSGVDPSAAKVRLAVRYVHDNLNRRLPISELASEMRLSPRHLARLFALYLGTSPAAYIEQARLERAKTLLRCGSSPIKSVAGAVGYESVHHFSRAFARHVGVPPGAFRESGVYDVAKSQKRGL